MNVRREWNGYFLDFYIEKNGKKIDFEVDGKQHWCEPERMEHDKERDAKLSELGYLVYRVRWNNINKEEGKAEMKEKISALLDFLNNC